MKKLPNGISNYEKLIEDGCYYVDKTQYIEKLENISNPNLMYLRPRKFGKTLFTSMISNYYDKLKADKFEFLFGNTYIGKKPTPNKNRYCVLSFNFSGIDTSNMEMTIKGFKEKVIIGIQRFINNYNIDFYINNDQTAEGMLGSLFEAFRNQKSGEKIYVIIDEYDHFANELLGFRTEDFKNLISKNGKVRKWYEILKEGTESVVDRIFITGVAPITLDSLTSGFNISKDITRDERFNEMVGFNEEELIGIMNEQNISEEEQETLLPIMRENYDGYRFSIHAENRMYNSNMCLYLLSDYIGLKRIPENLIDSNIASDFRKLENMLNLCNGEERVSIIENSIMGEPIISNIIEKFNPEMDFAEVELISMLYYLGYLTIAGESFGIPKLKIPNRVMRELYSEYFLESIKRTENISLTLTQYAEMFDELAHKGKIEKMIELLSIYLKNLSNRDYIKFDEKYVKIIFYSIAMNLKTIYNVKSEAEVSREYPDLLLIPRDRTKGYCSAMIEFKYLKKEDENKLEEKKQEAREQIERYSNYDEVKGLENLSKYIVIAVVDKIYVEQV